MWKIRSIEKLIKKIKKINNNNNVEGKKSDIFYQLHVVVVDRYSIFIHNICVHTYIIYTRLVLNCGE